MLPKGRALVPGCGRGYDVIAFGRSGYDSTGLDLSPTGVEQAKALLAVQKEEKISGKVKLMKCLERTHVCYSSQVHVTRPSIV